MSLRKSPQITPERHAARQASAQHSTGPRTPCGKQHSMLNALRHGERSDPAHHRLVMQALGEDPLEFEYLQKQLLLSYGPGDILWERQLDDLGRLYWRRGRQERAIEGMMRRARLESQERRQRQRQELAAATFQDPAALAYDLEVPADPAVRLRLLLSYLEIVRGQAQECQFEPRQAAVLRTHYGGCGGKGFRQARLCDLVERFRQPAESERAERYAELLGLLEAEIERVRGELEYALALSAEKADAEAESGPGPEDAEWQTLRRREGTLDRSIDRKVRILLAMRREYRDPNFEEEKLEKELEKLDRQLQRLGGNDNSAEEAAPDTMSEPDLPPPARQQKPYERTENVYENKGPAAIEPSRSAAAAVAAEASPQQGQQPQRAPAAKNV